MSQTYVCQCGQTNVRSARHCGRAGCQLPNPDPIVGHKTFLAEPGSGAMFRHEPLLQSEAEAILAQCEADRLERERLMPDERTAIELMWSAWYRLQDFGWREWYYCPKDGTTFDVIEAGSTGIHRTSYHGEWPKGFCLDAMNPVLFRPAGYVAAPEPQGDLPQDHG